MNVTENKNEATETTATATAAKKKLPLWGKILLVVVIVLAALAGLATLYVNGKLDLLHYNDGSVDSMGTIDADEDQDLDGSGLVHSDDEMTMPEGSPFADDDVLNILLIGTDERTEAVNDADAFTHLNQLDGTKDTTEFSEDARADSLILVSLDIKDHAIRLVSIERGLGVPILLDGYEGEYDWITHTFRYGGAKLTMDTVEDCFNVQVDHYVRFNFNSFVQIVDAVGGIDLNLTEDEAKALKAQLIRMADGRQVNLVLTTGGTGFSPRDITPEATCAVADRNAPGIAEAMRYHSLSITPRGMLSRGVSVLRGKTLIVNLPGSPKAVQENLEYILPSLEHGVRIAAGLDGECARK